MRLGWCFSAPNSPSFIVVPSCQSTRQTTFASRSSPPSTKFREEKLPRTAECAMCIAEMPDAATRDLHLELNHTSQGNDRLAPAKVFRARLEKDFYSEQLDLGEKLDHQLAPARSTLNAKHVTCPGHPGSRDCVVFAESRGLDSIRKNFRFRQLRPKYSWSASGRMRVTAHLCSCFKSENSVSPTTRVEAARRPDNVKTK